MDFLGTTLGISSHRGQEEPCKEEKKEKCDDFIKIRR